MAVCKQKDCNLYVALNDTIIIIDTKTQSDISVKVSEELMSNSKTTSKESWKIVSLDLSKLNGNILVATENKQLIIYDNTLKCLKNLQINRSASKVRFTPTNDILLADKTGDVYLYKFNSSANENILLLGHLSMLLDVLITDCGKYIITCDRDEKIRVSHFPNAYNIVSYCLGHSEFVTNLCLCSDLLISASGDGTVRLWNYIEGRQLECINTNEHIKDQHVKEKFCEEMDLEKVEINALPITDMQVMFKTVIYIAVTLCNVNEIQLYSVKLGNKIESAFMKSIIPISNLLTFGFGDELYVLTTKGFFKHILNKNPALKCLEKIYKKHESLFVASYSQKHNVTTLYKRKYDNVHEYLEKKKLRLDSK